MADETSERMVVLLTGAARGIGLSTAQVFLDRGYHVAVTDMDGAEAENAVFGLAAGDAAIALQLDVRSTEAVDACVKQVVDRLGRLDALVNLAGTTTSNPVPSEDEPDSEWSRHLETHLYGTFRACRAAYPYLKASGDGAIVNISSLAAHLSMRQHIAYTAAKAGIEGLTRLLGVEWAPTGVRVNAVAPGYIRTGRLDNAFKTGILDEQVLVDLVPQARLGRPDEIATVIAFLCSSDASHIIGQTLLVDGGASIDSGH